MALIATPRKPLNLLQDWEPHVGWLCWTGLALAVCSATVLKELPAHDVTRIYQSAALRWWNGEPLYNGTGTGFIYPPQSALLFLPLAWMPAAWCDLVWRVLNIACFAWGTRKLTNLANTGPNGARLFNITTLVSLPLCWSAARHGQMTLCMCGLMMWAGSCLLERRWWAATGLLTLAVGLKPLALPLVLLTGALYRRTSWRIVIGGALLACLPFACQSYAYVVREYASAWDALRDATQLGDEWQWAQLFWTLRLLGLEMQGTSQLVLQLLAAGATFGLCLWSMRQHPPARSLVYLLTLSCCYTLLLNPRTENNTYALMAPSLACFLGLAFEQRKHWQASWLGGAVLLLLLSHALKKLNIQSHVWLKPSICLLFTAYIVWHMATTVASAARAKRFRMARAEFRNQIL